MDRVYEAGEVDRPAVTTARCSVRVLVYVGELKLNDTAKDARLGSIESRPV